MRNWFTCRPEAARRPGAALPALACALVALGLATGCAQDTPASPTDDRTAIEAALRQWPNDFNAENLSGVCGLFATDVVLVYPDSPDRGHDAFCEQMAALFDDLGRKFRYDDPEIKEILVDGDLATVRLIWTLTVEDGAGRTLDTTREDGLDVFRRQADGTWKIHISHAFPAR